LFSMCSRPGYASAVGRAWKYVLTSAITRGKRFKYFPATLREVAAMRTARRSRWTWMNSPGDFLEPLIRDSTWVCIGLFWLAERVPGCPEDPTKVVEPQVH
jgi:hypothetical protein